MRGSIIEAILDNDVKWISNNISKIDEKELTNDVSDLNETYLFKATKANNTEIAIKFLNRAPQSLYVSNKLKYNPLHIAIINSNKYLIKEYLSWIIINNPPFLNIVTKDSQTYLSLAIEDTEYFAEDIVKMIVESGVPLDMGNFFNLPFNNDIGNYYHLCACNRKVKSIKFIYDYKTHIKKPKVTDLTVKKYSIKDIFLKYYYVDNEIETLLKYLKI
jgi:hypothetical protein